MTKWLLTAVVFCVMAVVGFAGAMLLQRSRPIAQEPEATEAKHRETISAFAATDAADAADHAEIAKFFDEFTAAMKASRTTAVDDIFDIDRMMRVVEAAPGAPRLSISDRRQFRSGLRMGMEKVLTGTTLLSPWDSAQVKLVRPVGNGGDVLVYVKHRYPDEGFSLRMRWWLHKSGAWRVYDYEDLDGGTRVTTLLGRLIMPNTLTPTTVNDMQNVQRAMQLAVAGDIDAAEQALGALSGRPLPTDLEAMRRLASSLVMLGRAEWDAALAELSLAEAANPEMPVVWLIRAITYNAKGESEPAIDAAQRHIAMVGPSAEAAQQLGTALLALERDADAAAAYRQGLEDEPDSADCIVGLGMSLPADQQAEVGQHFARSSMTQALFRTVAGLLHHADTTDALAAVVEAYRTKHGANLDGDYYLAMVQYLRGDHVAAAGTLRPHLGTDDAFYRDGVFTSYLDAMREAGQAIEGYRTAGDAKEAFNVLATSMLYGDDSSRAALEELIATHRAASPDDAHAWYMQGRLHQHREQFPEAEQAFARAETMADAESAQTYRYARVYCAFRAGKGVETYRNSGGDRDVFDQLASLYSMEDDAAGLEELVAEHRRSDAGDAHLPLWEAETHFLRGSYEHAIALLRAHRSAAEDEDRPFWYYEDRLLRSLIRSGQFDAAIEHVRSQEDGDEFMLAVIHAVRGDVPATLAALHACVEEGWYDAYDLYEDEDLGPALRSDAMATVREKYPEPKEEELEVPAQ